jgi:FKBP-type peptidyl-prolyl cis-trans isomerase
MKMKIKTILTLGVVFTALAVITSCSKYPGFKKTDSGIMYKFFVENKDAKKPVEGEIMTLNIKYRMKLKGKDSTLFNSAELGRPFEISLAKSAYKGDIYEAFGMLHLGDSATFIINAKDFFIKTANAQQLPEGSDSTSMLYFDVKLLKAETMEARQKAEKEKADKLKGEEPAKLSAYFAKNKVSVAPTASGIYVIMQKPGAGPAIQKTQYVEINLTVASIDGKKIFSTMDNGQPITFEYGQPFDTKGFDEAIGMMKNGSKATVVVPSAMGFGETGRKDRSGADIIQPYSPVVYDIEILSVKSKAEYEKAAKEKEAAAKKAADEAMKNEPALIQKYLSDNKITVKPTASGLYYIERTKGTGARAIISNKVQVHYTGKLLNGTIFDSSLTREPKKPLEFVLGQGQVIPGWDEGIALMNAGGKATFIVPSRLGYGPQGNGAQIPANTPLVFDVELVSVQK